MQVQITRQNRESSVKLHFVSHMLEESHIPSLPIIRLQQIKVKVSFPYTKEIHVLHYFQHHYVVVYLIRDFNKIHYSCNFLSLDVINTLRTGLLNCLNARSRGLTFRHRASCI